ncbi:MAG: hypothetical protein PSN44_00200 [Gammaproteobacteria bacterium]|nr:hypothetical protein [Gammaproteobacteria bacterium]
MATKLGLIKAKMPEPLPHIAVYSLIILDRLMQKVSSLKGIAQAINAYPEDTHREGFVCKDMTQFVAEFPTFELLKQGVEQQLDENGGRSSTESHYDSMERLESWYDE